MKLKRFVWIEGLAALLAKASKRPRPICRKRYIMKHIWLLCLLFADICMGELPVRFDLRDAGGQCLVSPVKRQLFNDCWAFAAMASMESSALMEGYGTFDLSEWHMANYGKEHDLSGAEYASPYPNWQGRSWLAMYYLTAGLNLASEIACPQPLPVGSLVKPTYDVESTKLMIDSYAQIDVGVTVRPLSSAEMEKIKSWITTRGAVSWGLSDYIASHLNMGSMLYCSTNPNKAGEGHSVSVVGWDDEIVLQDADGTYRQGAWIAKNSYGPSWGSLGGYFYISYADLSVDLVASYKARKKKGVSYVSSMRSFGEHPFYDYSLDNPSKAEEYGCAPAVSLPLDDIVTEKWVFLSKLHMNQSGTLTSVGGWFSDQIGTVQVLIWNNRTAALSLSGSASYLLYARNHSTGNNRFCVLDLEVPISVQSGIDLYVGFVVPRAVANNLAVDYYPEGSVPSGISLARPTTGIYSGSWIDLGNLDTRYPASAYLVSDGDYCEISEFTFSGSEATLKFSVNPIDTAWTLQSSTNLSSGIWEDKKSFPHALRSNWTTVLLDGSQRYWRLIRNK